MVCDLTRRVTDRVRDAGRVAVARTDWVAGRAGGRHVGAASDCGHRYALPQRWPGAAADRSRRVVRRAVGWWYAATPDLRRGAALRPRVWRDAGHLGTRWRLTHRDRERHAVTRYHRTRLRSVRGPRARRRGDARAPSSRYKPFAGGVSRWKVACLCERGRFRPRVDATAALADVARGRRQAQAAVGRLRCRHREPRVAPRRQWSALPGRSPRARRPVAHGARRVDYASGRLTGERP